MPVSTDDFHGLRDVTLALIAGGLGTRMGGPKAWLRVDGRSILSWMLDRLHWPGPTLLVTAPAVPAPPGREWFDRHVIDPVDGQGPLRGVLTALEHADTPIVVALAVDMPLVTRPVLEWLTNTLLQRSETLGVMGQISADGSAHVEPFPAAYRIEARSFLADQLTSGQRSLHKLCRDVRFVAQPVPTDWPAETWTNLNDPAQFTEFENGVAPRPRETAV